MRVSAREFHAEVDKVRGGIAAFLAQNNRPLRDKPLERAMKEAWKKKNASGPENK